MKPSYLYRKLYKDGVRSIRSGELKYKEPKYRYCSKLESIDGVSDSISSWAYFFLNNFNKKAHSAGINRKVRAPSPRSCLNDDFDIHKDDKNKLKEAESREVLSNKLIFLKWFCYRLTIMLDHRRRAFNTNMLMMFGTYIAKNNTI